MISLNEYEILLEKGYDEGIEVIEMPLESDSDALCVGDTIALNTRQLNTTAEKRCILSEELWHSRVTVGNITDIRDIKNLKQERFARNRSFNELVPPDKIVNGLLTFCNNIHDLAEYLGVTAEFLNEAFNYYKQKYGLSYRCKDYTLCFEPISVIGSYIVEDY